MSQTSTHFFVPISAAHKQVCLGPDGAAAHVARTMRMLQGRWKLPILFRLVAEPSMRTLQLKRDIPGISQKMLTQHLRELVEDGIVERRDFGEKPLHVAYRLTEMGRDLMPVLLQMRHFSADHPSRTGDAVTAADPQNHHR